MHGTMKIKFKKYIKSCNLKKVYDQLSNKINEVGRLKYGIDMHSAASACSFTVGDQKLSDICYFLKERPWRFYSKCVICYHVLKSANRER